MLILTRKKDESIIIDDKIKIKVIDIDGNRVQLGISAPESITIHREEVYLEIQEENKMAALEKVNLSELAANLKKGASQTKNKKGE
ncbi:carbon storage regulator CsrA [Halocella sp. SP3-1]|uniref:carbon storage regulator CsrA n=1 Tax=Halocella sp. SP3-1 TaxID=2382161 RepID=UPI000F7591D0|nr:carbon storage regulator CsrA [Halocella sp. SP3-1]AZO94003.1 carbon storage regulator [Halocella sp. SP3-1]